MTEVVTFILNWWPKKCAWCEKRTFQRVHIKWSEITELPGADTASAEIASHHECFKLNYKKPPK